MPRIGLSLPRFSRQTSLTHLTAGAGAVVGAYLAGDHNNSVQRHARQVVAHVGVAAPRPVMHHQQISCESSHIRAVQINSFTGYHSN